MTFLDDEETPADPKPAATTEMSNEDMIAMALTALAPALLGGAMGGKQGALAGGAAGAKGAASVFQYQADEESETKKMANAMAAKEGSRQQNLTDQRGLIDYKDELDRGKPKTEKVGGTLLSMSADGKSATPLYTEPVKPEKPAKDITVAERNTLQNQYDRDPEVKKVKEVLNSYNNIQSLKNDPSPASDQALIFAYMKALDPGSVVRESEYETAQAIGSLKERAAAKYAQMAGDGQLTASQRADIVAQVEKIAQSQGDRITELDGQFGDLATRRGVDSADMRFVRLPKFGGGKSAAGPAAFKGRETTKDGVKYREIAPDQWEEVD